MTEARAPVLKAGQTVRVPLPLWGGNLEVDCVLLDQRTVYGRSEWLIGPVAGGESAVWVREATVLGESAEQQRGSET